MAVALAYLSATTCIGTTGIIADDISCVYSASCSSNANCDIDWPDALSSMSTPSGSSRKYTRLIVRSPSGTSILRLK